MPVKAKAVLGSLAFLTSLSSFAALPPPPSAGYTAEVFSFGCIQDCSAIPSLGDQLFMQVIKDADLVPDDPNVYFKLWNRVGIPSSVEQVSVDGWSQFIILGGSGTNFVTANSPNPKNLPAGNLATPPFESDFTFEADPNGPGGKPVAGIDTNTDTFEFYTNTASYDQVIAGIGSGELRFGLHIIASQSTAGPTYLINTAPVPEPTTYALMLAGIGVVGFIVRRRLRHLA